MTRLLPFLLALLVADLAVDHDFSFQGNSGNSPAGTLQKSCRL